MSSQLPPPHDLDAERAVMSTLLLDPDRVADIATVLDPRDHYDVRHRWIHTAIVTLDADSRRPDPVSVLGWLRDQGREEIVGGAPYLAELSDTVAALPNIVDHARRVVRLARVRAVQAECKLVLAESTTSAAADEGWINTIESRFYALGSETPRESIRTAFELACAEHERLHSQGEPDELAAGEPIATGIRSVDALIVGLRRKTSFIIAARPGHGKTSVTHQISLNIASRGHGVHFVSLEMPEEQLRITAVSQLAMIDNERIARRQLQDHEWVKIQGAIDHYSKLPFTVDDQPDQTVQQIRNSIRRGIAKQRKIFGEKHRLGLVVVDYIQLCQAPKEHTREQEVAACSRGLRAIAKEFDVAVLVLSQLNREIENRPTKEPRLSDLRESGAIEQDAYGVMFVHRPDMYETEENRKTGAAYCTVAKHRQGGRMGRAELMFLADCTYFKERPDQLSVDFDNRYDAYRE